MNASDEAPWLNCPNCDTPIFEAEWRFLDGGMDWVWFESDCIDCPDCRAVVWIDVDDGIAETNIDWDTVKE